MGMRYALGSLVLTGVLLGQSVVFTNLSQLSVGMTPGSTATGFFTIGGKLDLVVADEGAAKLSILRGFGNGFFTSFSNQSTSISPRAVVTGDFDQDGRMDLAVANYASNTVSVFVTTGPGTFRTEPDLVTQGPSAIAVADFNGDGRPDLAVAETNSNTIAIFLGIGMGRFQQTVYRFSTGRRPVSVALGDFDEDGKLDLAVANQDSNSVSILRGLGNGTFRPALEYSAGPLPAYVTVGDFNNDGHLDLAFANQTGYSTGTVTVLQGLGNATFRSPLSFEVGSNPSFVTSADLNLDGRLDLAVADTGTNTISVLLGVPSADGNMTFKPRQVFEVGSAPAWITVADLNGDGLPDLVVTNSRSGTVQTLINHSARGNVTITSVMSAASLLAGSIAPGEMIIVSGSGFGPGQLITVQLTDTFFVSTALGQVQVFFDGIAAPLISVSAGQVTAMVPFGVRAGSTIGVIVQDSGTTSAAFTIPVVDSAPALFTSGSGGSGGALIANEDGSLNSTGNAAAKGSVVTLYGTGAGQTSPAGIDGLLTAGSLPQLVLPLSVTIDGKPSQVLYAGAAPGLVAGVVQVNVRVPQDTRSGTVPVVLRIGNGTSRPDVTLAVQ